MYFSKHIMSVCQHTSQHLVGCMFSRVDVSFTNLELGGVLDGDVWPFLFQFFFLLLSFFSSHVHELMKYDVYIV